MRKSLFILIIILFLSGCRSLGSWYGNTPPPSKELILKEYSEIDYLSKRVIFNSMTYDIIVINPRKIQLEIIRSPDEKGLSFTDLEWNLLFAVNGGMYQEDRTPLGYFSSKGVEQHPLNRNDGFGNFYIKPNGIFFIDDHTPWIMETEQFHKFLTASRSAPQLATQSGPLLVYSGKIHKAFNKGSDNKFVRNAVGIIPGIEMDLIVFAISNRPVNFYDFALFFKKFLHCSDALYLDGHISSMYLPYLNRNQKGRSFGTILYIRLP